VLLDDDDHLLLAEPIPTHPLSPRMDLTTTWREFRGAGHRERRFNGTIAGHIPKSGYGYISLGKFRLPIAQCIRAYHNGWLPDRIFRKDGNPRNHRLENLYV
jgi:hypothetical protein